MDEVIFEEFKGTGNMELVLTRALSERRIFPAIDIAKSGTRREERLLTRKEMEFVWKLRRNFSERDQATLLEEMIHDMLHTANNDEFMDIFSLGR
jgi:transcription termination factor Rho